jgi:hypothetical protein
MPASMRVELTIAAAFAVVGTVAEPAEMSADQRSPWRGPNAPGGTGA